ncbi:hypothetical protein AMS68_006091 [Peltaster fructicola]|uniref:Mog1p/PsbP-like protein n=1 Tax=Peltaster fructicola TaxID=286661 RepID=A0A6H0Y0P2_9PEZI|nr:hypothetical protein AMS68_006091 [Peltaster fructicola]
MAFHSIDLFGGSIVADLPSSFADVSDFRQVPDHQEVYLDKDGFTSIVVEILERVEQPDIEALKYHLHDLVDTDASQTKIITAAEAHFAKLPPGTSAYTLLAIAPPDEKQRGRANEPDFVAIYLTMLRLPEQKTDLLVAVNVPYIAGQYDPATINQEAGQLGSLGQNALSIRDTILQTLNIKDWSLFVQD